MTKRSTFKRRGLTGGTHRGGGRGYVKRINLSRHGGYHKAAPPDVVEERQRLAEMKRKRKAARYVG